MTRGPGRIPEKCTDDEVVELGKDLLDWLDREGKEEIHFEPWFYGKHKMFRDDWKNLIQRKYFLPYYKIARKKIMGNVIKNKEIPQSYGNRYLNYYNDEMLEHEEGIRDREAKRRLTENKAVPANDAAVETLLSLISANKSLNERLEALSNATKSETTSVDSGCDTSL